MTCFIGKNFPAATYQASLLRRHFARSRGVLRRAPKVAKVDFCWIPHRQTVRRYIRNHYAIGPNNRSLAYCDALHDVGSVANPGMSTNPHGTNILRINWSILSAKIRLTRMSVTVGDSAVEGDPRILLYDNLPIHGNAHSPAQFDPVLQDQSRALQRARRHDQIG